MSNSSWTIFPPVPSSQVADKLSTTTICDDSDGHISKLLSRQLFTQAIQVVAQDERLLSTVRNFVSESSELAFLLLRNMPIYSLISPQFLDAFCRKGTLYGLSVNRDVNLDDTFALLPNQILLLSLNARTYFKLGLIGQKSILNRKKNLIEKYRVEIDLGKDYFKPEKKNFQRTYECLKRSKLKCDFILKWIPHMSDISPNSLERYFETVLQSCKQDEFLSRMTIHKCYPTLRTHTNYSSGTFAGFKDGKLSDETVNDFIEWISAQVAEVKLTESDNELQTFSNVYCAEIKGFFTHSNVVNLLNALKGCFATSEQTGAIVVHGFEDSPQCWTGRNNEHYKDVSGDNLVGIGQFEHQVVSWCTTDQFDFGIEKL